VITTEPPPSVTAGSGFGLTVAAEDSFGNLDPSYTGSVTLALANGPGGAVLGGMITVPAAGGVAGFADLTLSQAGAGQTVEVSSVGLGPATTSAINVSAGPAAQLVVVTEPPASLTAGSGFGLAVAAADRFGNVDPSFSGSVTLTLASNPGSATLAGTLTVPAAAGVATFSGLALERAGAGDILQASSGMLSPASTSNIAVSAAAATQLAIATPPPSRLTAGDGFGLIVAAQDPFGNVDLTFSGLVTLALASGPNGARLGGTPVVTARAGLAVFSGLTLDQTSAGDTLQAASGSLGPALTSNLTVSAAPSTHLVITTEPPAGVTAGAGFDLTVTAEDPFGNVDPSFAGSISLTPANNPAGATLGGTLTLPAVAGVAAFAGLSLDKAATAATLQATSGSLGPALTSPLAVSAAPATQLVIVLQPPAGVTAGSVFSLTAAAEDRFGNVDPTFAASVTTALADNDSGAALGGTLTVTARAGLATFTGLSLDQTAPGDTLMMTSPGLNLATSSPINVSAAPAAQLVITAMPPARLTAGSGFGLAVAAEDRFGNVDRSFVGSVTIALADNPGGGTLGGTPTATATASAGAGVATFAGLALDKAATGTTLELTSTGLTDALTDPVTVTPAPATRLAIATEPPGSVTAGSGFGLAVAAEDAFGNIDPSYAGSITLALASNAAGAALGGTLNLTPTAGIATFSGLTLDRSGPGETLRASSASLTAATTSALTVSAAPATHLVIASGPPTDVPAGDSFGLTVAAEDGFGNIDASFPGNVTIALAHTPADETLGGTLTVPAVAGVAVLPDLSLTKAATGDTLTAASPGLNPATTGPIAVSAASATHLAMAAEPPPSVMAGSAFRLTVSAEDRFGNVDPAFAGTVTISLPGDALVPSQPAVAGVATFSNLVLDQAGTGAALTAASPGLNPATSTSVTVTAGPATHLVITTAPPARLTAGAGFGLVVAAEDAFGNVDPRADGNVTLALANNPGGAALGGTLTVPAVAGLATFSGLTLDQAADDATLQASARGLSPATSTAFIVSPAPAVQLVVTAQPPASVTAGAGFGLVVTAEDAFGNIDPGYGGGVTIAVADHPTGAALGGSLTTTAVAGVATFTGLSLDRAAPGDLLQASAGGLTGATTRPIAVAAAAAAQLVIATAPPASVNASTAFGLVVAAEDPFGNVDPTYGGTVSLALSSASPSASLGGTLTVPAAGGIATFTGLSLSAAASGAMLQATGSGSGLAGALTGIIAVIPPPTPVLGVSLETVSAGKHKPATLIVVQFDNPLSAATAQNLAAYSLATLAQGKKHPSKRLALSQASYNGAAHTVTLRPAKTLVLNPPLQLRISASALTDPLGRPLDADLVATLSKSGVTTARPALAAASVDALIATGFRPRSLRL
jgi:FKBP-type peptidyl-prolyl cis-trans isomerase 2